MTARSKEILAEVEDRIDVYERGDMAAIPATEVFARIDGLKSRVGADEQ